MRLIDADALTEKLFSFPMTITRFRSGQGILFYWIMVYHKKILQIVNEAPPSKQNPCGMVSGLGVYTIINAVCAVALHGARALNRGTAQTAARRWTEGRKDESVTLWHYYGLHCFYDNDQICVRLGNVDLALVSNEYFVVNSGYMCA